MSYKQIRVKKETDELLDKCIQEYLRFHPEFHHIPISRNKIIYEMGRHYLKRLF